MHGFEVQASPGEQVLEREAVGWRVGVKREVHPLDVYIEIPLQLFNTPGTEIAPGSDEVGEYFQCDRFTSHSLHSSSVWPGSAPSSMPSRSETAIIRQIGGCAYQPLAADSPRQTKPFAR